MESSVDGALWHRMLKRPARRSRCHGRGAEAAMLGTITLTDGYCTA